MQTLKKGTQAELLNFAELSHEERELITVAHWARQKAQAPLSLYLVGAAVRSESFRFYFGCNVERSTYDLTTHAERNAIDTLIAHEGPAKIAAIAVVHGLESAEVTIMEVAPIDEGHTIHELCFACAECLQIIWDNCMGDPEVKLLTLTNWGKIARSTIGDAYPMRFGFESLGIDIRRRS